jgi:hypothetical protein
MFEWGRGLTHKIWTEVSSSVPHFLQVGLLLSPIMYRCLIKVLCPVSRPITTLDCVLLKDNNPALVARSGPEINSRACLCVQGPRHNTRCCFSIQRFIFLLIFCLETTICSITATCAWTISLVFLCCFQIIFTQLGLSGQAVVTWFNSCAIFPILHSFIMHSIPGFVSALANGHAV